MTDASDKHVNPKALLDSYGLRAKRSFGQNFLMDEKLASRIAELATTPSGGSVVEIGAGTGALTGPLLARARHVAAIERDRDLLPVLRARFTEELDGNELAIPVVPEQDLTAWREALTALLSDPALYRRQSAAARQAAHRFVAGLGVGPLEEVFAYELRACREIVEDGCADPDPWQGFCSIVERISVLNARNQGFVDTFMDAHPDSHAFEAHRRSLLRQLTTLARRATGGNWSFSSHRICSMRIRHRCRRARPSAPPATGSSNWSAN